MSKKIKSLISDELAKDEAYSSIKSKLDKEQVDALDTLVSEFTQKLSEALEFLSTEEGIEALKSLVENANKNQ